MSHLSAREQYTRAYRQLRVLLSVQHPNLKAQIDRASVAGDLIVDAYGFVGSKAILSFNQRNLDQWRLMRHRHRLQHAVWVKNHPSPFGAMSIVAVH